MTSNGEGWHYIAVKRLSALLRGITPKNNGDFLLLKLSKKKQHKFHKKVCENKDFCSVEMPSEDTKILEFNQCNKSDKAPFIIYADL